MDDTKTIKDLGCANGWRTDPEEYKLHVAKGPHTVTTEHLGRCWTEYTCETCGIRWNVDSSD